MGVNLNGRCIFPGCDVHFENTVVPMDNIIGLPGDGFKVNKSFQSLKENIFLFYKNTSKLICTR